LAIWASGSLISGLITGLVVVRATPRVRFRWGSLGLALAMTPLPFVPNLWVLAVLLFVGGFAISPTLVATVSLIETEVPPARLTEGMTWLSTGIAVGLAPGAAIAGQIIDAHGASTAYWVPVVSGLIAASIAWSTGWRSGIGSGMVETAAR
jgi:predicted MFS family arabinose efflux permease